MPMPPTLRACRFGSPPAAVAELDEACEQFLARQFGCKIDFYCEEVRGWTHRRHRVCVCVCVFSNLSWWMEV